MNVICSIVKMAVKSLLKALPELKKEVGTKDKVLVFINSSALRSLYPHGFGGLTPVLNSLASNEKYDFVITGPHSPEELQSVMEIAGAIYAPFWGLEINMGNINYLNPDSMAYTRAMKEIQEGLGEIPGLKIKQDKYQLSINYDDVPDPDVLEVRKSILMAVKGQKRVPLEPVQGKKILSVRPRKGMDEGAISIIYSEASKGDTLAVFFGNIDRDMRALKTLRSLDSDWFVHLGPHDKQDKRKYFAASSAVELQQTFQLLDTDLGTEQDIF